MGRDELVVFTVDDTPVTRRELKGVVLAFGSFVTHVRVGYVKPGEVCVLLHFCHHDQHQLGIDLQELSFLQHLFVSSGVDWNPLPHA